MAPHAHGPLLGVAPPPAPDPSAIIEVEAKDGKTGEDLKISYSDVKLVGSGSFGVVSSATLTAGIASLVGDRIAIKKMVVDPVYRSRELSIMRKTSHPNILDLIAFFYTQTATELTLSLILEYLPIDLDHQLGRFNHSRQRMPALEVKLYAYQLFRGLGYLHVGGVCHRDIKPHNLLVDPVIGVLKIIDFGSAKQLVEGEPNVAYICSRWYRAPELIFGATNYTTKIDMWSAATVLAEVIYGQPLFRGATSIDYLVDVIKVLGTPTPTEVLALNPRYENHRFPSVRRQPLDRVFRPRTDPLLIDLLSKVLVYTPSERLDAFEALAHPYFDELRQETTRLASGEELPPLFNFTKQELSGRPDLVNRLVPEWARPELLEKGIDVENFVPMTPRDLRFVFE
ncbi:putative glycogen synthase kinase 3 alpha [Mrakia frigida]|uniref:GSK family serine/threonine-protein kinase n=1 Tax=Mrakia frigida TaxID=29902 RepID=UPI003FCC2704